MASRREEKERLKAERLAAAEAERQAAGRRQRAWMLGGALALAAAIVVVVIIVSQSGNDGSGKVSAGLLRGIPQKGIALGEAKAPVTMVEFADPQCPFCAQYSNDVFPQIVKKYVRTGKVRMELRLLSFLGPDSVRAAQVAAAASLQDRYWSFTENFYAKQKTENTGYVTDEFLRDVGSSVPGLDMDKVLNEAGTSPSVNLLRKADSLANKNAVQSTPSFLIGPTGGKLTTLSPAKLEFSPFQKAIDAQLAKTGG